LLLVAHNQIVLESSRHHGRSKKSSVPTTSPLIHKSQEQKQLYRWKESIVFSLQVLWDSCRRHSIPVPSCRRRCGAAHSNKPSTASHRDTWNPRHVETGRQSAPVCLQDTRQQFSAGSIASSCSVLVCNYPLCSCTLLLHTYLC